jgi:hypothetical protein
MIFIQFATLHLPISTNIHNFEENLINGRTYLQKKELKHQKLKWAFLKNYLPEKTKQ